MFPEFGVGKKLVMPAKAGIQKRREKNGFTLGHNYMKRRFVILNEVKNLIGSMSSVGEILRLHLRMTLRHSRAGGNRAPVSVHSRRGESPLQAYALRPVAERNCVTVRWGGKQREVKSQSVG